MAKKGGVKDSLLSLGMIIIVLGGVAAVARLNNINSVDDALSFFRRKSVQTEACYKSGGECLVVPDVDSGSVSADGDFEWNLTDADLNYTGVGDGQAFLSDAIKKQKEYVLSALDKLKITKDDTSNDVNLKDWQYWAPISDESSCWTSKKEVLAEQAVEGSLKFETINHEETDNIELACRITAGEWVDPYTGEPIDDPAEMDVDHVISIPVVNSRGGAEWDSTKKQEYANDTDLVLLAVSKKSLEEKGDKDITEYVPENKDFTCEFAKTYTLISDKYGLSITEDVKNTLGELIVECDK